MRVVVFMKAVRFQPLGGDRFFDVIRGGGVEIVAVVCQTVSLAEQLRRVGARVGLSGTIRKIAGRLGTRPKGLPQRSADALSAPASARPRLRRFNVPSHNGPECHELLRRLRADVVLLRGTDIVKPATIEAAGTVLNVHYGPLPAIRGVDAIQWSVLLGLKPTLTLHRVDAGIDTGEIIMTRELPLRGCQSFADVSDHADHLSPELFRDGCIALGGGGVNATPNPGELGRQYYRMHPYLLALANDRLLADASSGEASPTPRAS
ncbi:MAG: formyltransferase family protein [Gemmatimonadales bacterium]